MDSLRFDAWTRRRIGLATGGMAAFIISAIAPGGLNARKKRKKKKRCKKVTQSCKTGKHKRRCCNGLRCDQVEDLDGRHCCRPLQATCGETNECCLNFFCGMVNELPPGTHCCGGSQVPCTEDADCCFNNPCTDGLCED
jgi:hypothetical protein